MPDAHRWSPRWPRLNNASGGKDAGETGQARALHGVPEFPDPVTSVPSNPLGRGINEVTDFDGAILLFPATINMQAPAYRQALAACGAPPLGLPH